MDLVKKCHARDKQCFPMFRDPKACMKVAKPSKCEQYLYGFSDACIITGLTGFRFPKIPDYLLTNPIANGLAFYAGHTAVYGANGNLWFVATGISSQKLLVPIV